MKTLLALLPLFSYAQGLTGIQSGFVFDTQSKVIRPVNGLPGVATLGEPVDVGVALNQVEFVRGSDVAYAAAEDRVYRIRLSTGTAETINETLAGGRLVAAGLFWIESSRTIQFLSDLSQVFVDSDGDLTAAVFNSSTNCAFLAFSSGKVESICGGLQTRLLEDPAVLITRIAFTSGATILLDSANNRILQMKEGQGITVLATALSRPVGIATINDTLLAVAEAGAKRVRFVSIGGSVPPDPISLQFAPSGLSFMSSDVLKLGEAGRDPFEVVDLAQQNRNFFVPAVASAALTARAGN